MVGHLCVTQPEELQEKDKKVKLQWFPASYGLVPSQTHLFLINRKKSLPCLFVSKK